MGFWSAYRPDILREAKAYHCGRRFESTEVYARSVTRRLIDIDIDECNDVGTTHTEDELSPLSLAAAKLCPNKKIDPNDPKRIVSCQAKMTAKAFSPKRN